MKCHQAHIQGRSTQPDDDFSQLPPFEKCSNGQFCLQKSTKFGPSDAQRLQKENYCSIFVISCCILPTLEALVIFCLRYCPGHGKHQTRQASIKTRANFPRLFRAVSKVPSLMPCVSIFSLRTNQHGKRHQRHKASVNFSSQLYAQKRAGHPAGRNQAT